MKNTRKFDCMEECEMKEYVGCKMVCKQAERSLKMMQTLLIQSFEEEFETQGSHHFVMPLVSILMNCDLKNKLTSGRQTKYHSDKRGTIQYGSCHVIWLCQVQFITRH